MYFGFAAGKIRPPLYLVGWGGGATFRGE